MNAASGLIKTDMSVHADAEYLQVEPASLFNLFFISEAMFLHFIFGYHAIRQVIIGGIDIGVLKQIPAHKIMIALQRIFIHRVVLVEVESDNVLKAQSFFLVHAHEFGV